MMLPIPESSISFFVSHNFVVCDSNKYYASIIYDIISYLLSMFKIKKSKN